MNSRNQPDHSDSVLQTNIIQIGEKTNQPIVELQSNEFWFQGDQAEFVQNMEKLTTEDLDAIQVCNISIIGEQIKQGNPKCLILTLLFAICFIFPFFFYCCQWWKKTVSQIFTIKQQTYAQFTKILKAPKLTSLTLRVYDNFLSKQKLDFLLRSIRKSNIKELTIINEAGAFDMNDQEYSQFIVNSKPFLGLPLSKLYIGWFKNYLSKQQIPK